MKNKKGAGNGPKKNRSPPLIQELWLFSSRWSSCCTRTCLPTDCANNKTRPQKAHFILKYESASQNSRKNLLFGGLHSPSWLASLAPRG